MCASPARNSQQVRGQSQPLLFQRGDEPVCQDLFDASRWRIRRNFAIEESCFQVDCGNPVGMIAIPAKEALKNVA